MDAHSCHKDANSQQIDYLLSGSLLVILIALIIYFFLPADSAPEFVFTFADSVLELIWRMWWGIIFGIVFVGILSHTPKELVMSALGYRDGLGSIMRATLAGLALDLCSHGILMVGMKFYQRGASLGQVMAFLIASPWNSFSLTIILISLIGLKWTLVFIVLSLLIAIISGMIFDILVRREVLPANPNRVEATDLPPFLPTLRTTLAKASFSPGNLWMLLNTGAMESRVVLRWVLFGVVLASLVRIIMSPETFAGLFGPSFAGLWLTLIAATIIEVCSEGATPIAADLLTRAAAPGNSFTFLMAGVSTDYTEIMSIKDTMKSWKMALFLPLVTLPQVIFIGWLLNQFS